MIIGQLGEAFPPINDGVAQVVKNYAYWLDMKGDKICVATVDHPDANDNYNFEVLRYKSITLPFYKQYNYGIPQLDRKFCKQLNEINFDIIHSHSPFIAGKLGLKIAKKLGVPCVMTFHSKFKLALKNIVKSDMITKVMLDNIMHAFSLADEVWTVSESTAETLRSYGYKGDVFITDNASDFDYEEIPDEEMDAINSEYKIPKDIPVLLFVGRIERLKNVHLILRSLKIVHDKGYDFRMLLVGEGREAEGFKKDVKSYGIENKVIFVGNIFDRQKLCKIYYRSTSILFPSLYDASSLVIKEASAFKRSAVLVEGSTTSSGVKDCYNGYLVQNNEQSLADKVMYILDNLDDVKKVGEMAHKTLYISWEQSVEKVRQRYQYLVENNRKRSDNA